MNMKFAKLGVALLGAAFVVVHADAQISKQGNGYLFRMKYTKGQTLSYVIGSAVTGPATMNLTMPMKMKVLGVTKGVADIEATAGPMSMGGKTTPARTVRMKMDARGQVVGGDNAMQGTSVPLPAGPIAVGASWTGKVPLGGAGGAQSLDAVYKFVGIKNVAGRQVAQLNVTIKGMANGTGTTYLATSDGSLVKSSMSMTLGQGAAGGQTMKMTATVTRK